MSEHLPPDAQRLKALLQAVQEGRIDVEAAWQRLLAWPLEQVADMARVDHHRALRQGFPEVVYGEGKTPAQVVAIVERLVEREGAALVTRLAAPAAQQVRERFPHAVYDTTSRVLRVGQWPSPGPRWRVGVLSAGTSDIPVAEEAAQVLEFLGHTPERVYDVGVAGLHRLLAARDVLFHADALIVVAGMEGALPSVVGGLTPLPVVAVPTSVGYGAHLGGLTPLLAMLNSCAAGVVVVNIDNGFGAALAVHRMATCIPTRRAGRG